MKNLLFLHGWGGSGKSFACIEGYFRARYNCVFVDFPCFQKGDDLSPKVPWTLDDYVKMAVDTVDKHGFEKFCIIAHSFGARVATILATRFPERVDKMVLTGPAGVRPRFSFVRWLKVRFYKLFKIGRGSADYRALSDVGKRTFQNIIGVDLVPFIRKNRVQTLLIWGDLDSAVPRYMVKLWTNLNPYTRLVAYKNAGHFCFVDCPAKFIIDSGEFLKDV